jgi:hypothetical protein
MRLEEKIRDLIAEAGVGFKEKQRTLYTVCPMCGKDDKFSILKQNGSCVCYRGSCSFGKRWFPEWLALTTGIPLDEAKKKVYSRDLDRVNLDEKLTFELHDNFTESVVPDEDQIKPVPFPEQHMIPIEASEAKEGLDYLANRGVDQQRASTLGIMYSPLYRRVIFPVAIGGTVYGYQGRAIDKVPDGQRMRNNEGFRRDRLVMFLDNIKDSKHAIICEGPINAIKFANVGGAVATMGKVVTDRQLDAILSTGIEKVYLALDDDAAKEMNELAEFIRLPVYKIDVPQSCIDRCRQTNKKPDFGECTYLECEMAFKTASLLDMSRLVIYLKERK